MYPQEILADEEPKYLRRQKPLEIKRRKFGRRAWKTYMVVSAWAFAGVAGCGAVYMGEAVSSSLHLEVALIHPEQIQVAGNHNVEPRERAADLRAGPRQERPAHSS